MLIVEYIQSILLIISAVFIIIAAIGIVSLNNNKKNINYARIHIVGIFDMAVILAMIAIGQYLLAGIYFILVPFTSHAIGYAFFKSEDTFNNSNIEKTEKEDTENPFIHSKSKLQDLERKHTIKDIDNGFSAVTLNICEDE